MVDAVDPRTRPSRAERRRGASAASRLLVVLVGLLSAVVLVPAACLLLPAETSSVTLHGTLAWVLVGPHLVLVSLVALVIAVALAARHRRIVHHVMAALAVVALASSTFVTGSIVAAVASVGGAARLMTALAPGSAVAHPDATEVYAEVGGRQLRALVFAPDRPVKSPPVLMYVHGGGWIRGSPADVGTLVEQYADRGWLVVSVGYRIATAAHPTWDEAPADVACALTWTVENASRWGGDTDRITVMGDSAGGNLAVNLAWSAATGRASSSCPELGEVPVPDAVVAGYPVVDPGYTYERGGTWRGVDPKDFISTYLGGTPSRFPERLAAISSLTYASASVPPTLIVEPERDELVPAEGVHRVVDAARRAGADVTLVRIPFAHHAFDMSVGTLGAQARLMAVERYLDQRGLAPSTTD